MPAGAEKSAFRRASASAPSIVEARERRVQALQDHRTSLRAASDAPPLSAPRGRRRASAPGVAGLPIRWAAPRWKGPDDHRRRRRIGLGNPGPAGWAWYVDDACWAAGGWPHATNNQARADGRARAVPRDGAPRRRAARAVRQPVRDQRVTKWMAGWKRKGWRKADGKPVMNVELPPGARRGAARPPLPLRVGEGPRRPRAERGGGRAGARGGRGLPQRRHRRRRVPDGRATERQRSAPCGGRADRELEPPGSSPTRRGGPRARSTRHPRRRRRALRARRARRAVAHAHARALDRGARPPRAARPRARASRPRSSSAA